MKVIIKEKEYDYVSDFPENWEFASNDYFKYPVNIGQHACFIKRFEKKKPQDISGWDLLLRLKHLFKPNLPRIYDIKSTEEHSRIIYYVFYECISGLTLDKLIREKQDMDLGRLTNDIFSALASLHQQNFWFSDFCEKNIFCEHTGRFLLIDVDSAQPLAKAPDNDMHGSKDYWAPVFGFYRDVLKYNSLRLSDIPGTVLNNLQVIFLVLHLKLLADSTQHRYMAAQEFTGFAPAYLDKLDPQFRAIFETLFRDAGQSHYLAGVVEIKELIFEKIINGNHELSADDRPVINSFDASRVQVHKGEPFQLSWQVENGTQLELYRNNLPFRRINADTTELDISEQYDGKDKQVTYMLVVENSSGRVESRPVMVLVTDKKAVAKDDKQQEPVLETFPPADRQEPEKQEIHIPEDKPEPVEVVEAETRHTAPVIIPPLTQEEKVVPEDNSEAREKEKVISEDKSKEREPVVGKPDEKVISTGSQNDIAARKRRERQNRNIRLVLMSLVAAIVVAVSVILYSASHRKTIIISAFSPREVVEQKTIFINGRFPVEDSGKLEVFFNNVKGAVTIFTGKTIYVRVPPLGDRIGNGNVRIAMVVTGHDTVYAKDMLLVKREAVTVINTLPAAVDSAFLDTVKAAPVVVKQKAPKKVVKKDSAVAVNETVPKVEAVHEEPKKTVNLRDFVTVSSNEFKKGILGGIHDLKVTVKNDSPYDVDNVTVEVSYRRNNEKELKNESLSFSNIKAHTSLTLDAPKTNRGKKVDFTITSITSSQLDKSGR